MIAFILSFSLKSALCSAVFFGYYLLVLKNVRMHHFNRFYLLIAGLLSLWLPFAKFQLPDLGQTSVPDFPLLGISGHAAAEVSASLAINSAFDWNMLAGIAYLFVTAIVVLNLAVKIGWVYHLKRGCETAVNDGFLLIKTDHPSAPFSFLNMLFWPRHMRQDNTESRGILMHEAAHIKQYHTIDKILMQLILAAGWLNPFNWLIKNELWLQHEFLADRHSVKDGDSEAFAKMLLFSVANTNTRSIISPFFQSPIKRRLQMLTKPVNNNNGLLRRFMAIPMLLATVLITSAGTKDTPNVSSSPEKIVMVLDAAHGGEDNGGESIYGYTEKDMALAICKKMVSLSPQYNIEIISTRDQDASASLQQRLHTSNTADAAVFLSIHLNKSTPQDMRGNSYEIGLDAKNPNYSKTVMLASAIAGKLKKQQLDVKLVDTKAYVVKENKHPALILECGNVDDADNIAMLRDDARTETLCRNILSGIVDYHTKTKN